jgi:hypothetical protein
MGQLGDALMEPLQRRLREAGEAGQRGDFAAMLSLLDETELRRCVDDGVAAVSALTGATVESLWTRIPFDSMHALAVDVGAAQASAVQVWNENHSGWAAVWQDLSGVGVDALLNNVGLGQFGIGSWLSNFAGGKLREERFRQAIEPFATKLEAFEASVEQSALQLDADSELVAAMTKKERGNVGCGYALLIACAFLLVGLGYLAWRGWKWAFDSSAPSASASVPVTAPAAPPPRRSSPLVGEWTTASGQALRAVELGDAVELEIIRLGPWADQGYAEGEMRFRLRPLGDRQDVFTVEDKTRPVMPKGIKFAAESAESCHVIRSDVDEAPLRARLTADRLVIESARSSLPATAFRWQGGAIVGCSMDRALVAKVEIVLTRTRPNTGGPSAASATSGSP